MYTRDFFNLPQPVAIILYTIPRESREPPFFLSLPLNIPKFGPSLTRCLCHWENFHFQRDITQHNQTAMSFKRKFIGFIAFNLLLSFAWAQVPYDPTPFDITGNINGWVQLIACKANDRLKVQNYIEFIRRNSGWRHDHCRWFSDYCSKESSRNTSFNHSCMERTFQ